MSKMSNLSLLFDELIEHGEAIVEIAKEMKSMFPEEPTALPEKTETKKPETTTTLSFTDLRAKLAEKSREGFTAEIKAILNSHGAEKLSAIQPADYETVLKEVEALSHE